MGAGSLILMGVGMTLSYLRRSGAPPSEEVTFWLGFLAAGTLSAYPLVGAVVASRRPRNVVGWLLCTVGLAIALLVFTTSYGPYARAVHPGFLPGAEIAAFLSSINPVYVLAGFVFLFFPDGRLPSRRWRPLVWLLSAEITLYIVAEALNPSGARSLGFELPSGIYEVLSRVYGAAFVVGLVGSVASVALRLRRGRGEERQQVKWFVYAASVMAVSGLGSLWFPSPASEILWTATLLSFGAVPIAVGIAVLRYRLYDIDILINRTLVYGSLTVLLGVTYYGSVVVLQGILRAITGQESPLAVVASTLAIAALFSLLSRRVQAFVDRRFYRRKYDASKTLETFSARLRDETDLDALSDDLVGVVWETMQPAHVSLWLRPDPKLNIDGVALRELGHK